MRMFICILSILISGIANAEVYKCDISQINGVAPAKPSSVIFDPGRLLMNINRGNDWEILLSAESIYVIDANAIWYDRASDCQYKRVIGGSTFRHTFDCGSEVKTKIIINWDRGGSMGDFRSTLEVSNMQNKTYAFDFQHCKLFPAH